jgi:hypothetical protein
LAGGWWGPRPFSARVSARTPFTFYRRLGPFGPGGSADDLRSWARDAGLERVQIERSGAIARIDAVRAG